MTPLVTLHAKAVPLMRDNVDTDAIIPSREMKTVSKTGLASGLFAGWRYVSTTSRERKPDFVLNDPRYEGAKILISGANFGCGSSREHAVWALADFGLQAIIAPSFGEIFRSNCANNGLIAAQVAPDALAPLRAAAEAQRSFTVDLRSAEVAVDEIRTPFAIPDSDRELVLEGWNTTTRMLALHGAEIAQFEASQRVREPWLWTKD